MQDLSEHNDRSWFEANKDRYRDAKARVDLLAEELIAAIRTFDDSIGPLSAKDCTWRIYRDTRFSHDKRPYKTQIGVYVAPGGKKSGYSGYYFQIGAPDAGHMLAAGNYFCFPADGPDAEFYKLKNFCLVRMPDDRFVTDKGLVERLADVFKTTKPFLDYINRAITYYREESESCGGARE